MRCRDKKKFIIKFDKHPIFVLQIKRYPVKNILKKLNISIKYSMTALKIKEMLKIVNFQR